MGEPIPTAPPANSTFSFFLKEKKEEKLPVNRGWDLNDAFKMDAFES
jgi:hypothetical protein